MPADHLQAVLESHWRLLWLLTPAERLKRFAEIEADVRYDATLQAVEAEMAVL